MENIRFDSISLPMLVLLIFVISLIIYILIIEPRIFRRKLTNKNEHGSSKFADFKEIKNNFSKESINNINNAAFPVWYSKEGNKFKDVYFDTKSPHYLIIGSTGSGKSATISIPMSIQYATAKEKQSVVLTDPKGELFKKTGGIFKDNGYNVITLDFRNPTKSNKINIMQPIIDEWKQHCSCEKKLLFFLTFFLKNNKITVSKFIENEKYQKQIIEKYNLEKYIVECIKLHYKILSENKRSKKYFNEENIKQIFTDLDKTKIDTKTNEEILFLIKEYQNESANHQAESNRLVISLGNLIFVEDNAKDPFWMNSAKQLFIGLAGLFLEDYKAGLITENKINIASIKKFQNSSLIKENQTFLQRNINSREYGCLSKDYLTSIFSAAENTFKSISSIFGEKMSIFDDLNVENITSSNDGFEFTDIGKKPTALYIIVPDEDKSYYQLVTIILGMLIKDLTKFANSSENNGVLPTKVIWLLEEFANCPPLDSIETTVSVARSRGMSFIFFIQSFAQLDQVYGKEIASIIIDNTALCYLKTNSVDCAQVIANKLGKYSCETQSLNQSTDIFKVGANITTSLIGRELLTPTEIIALKYKTIIFPTFGNPIFRDTYIYDEIYPKFSNYRMLERKTNALNRNGENYYTVEDMKKQTQNSQVSSNKFVREMQHNLKREISMEEDRIFKNTWKQKVIKEDLDIFESSLKAILKSRLIDITVQNGIHMFNINGILNKFDMAKLNQIQNNNLIIEIARNTFSKKTILSVWTNEI